MSERAAEIAGVSPGWTVPFFAAMDDSSLRPQAVLAIDSAVTAGEVNQQVEFIARVLLEDLDGALRVAQDLEQPGEIFEMDLLFIPEVEPLRAHPGFGALMTSLGIREYWSELNCTWAVNSVRCDGD